jgi:hypothetical protein
MTPSRLLRLAKTLLATPENIHEGKHTFWICTALRCAAEGRTVYLEIFARIDAEIEKLAPGLRMAFYPAALAYSMNLPSQHFTWNQEVRHAFVDQLIAEYEAQGR